MTWDYENDACSFVVAAECDGVIANECGTDIISQINVKVKVKVIELLHTRLQLAMYVGLATKH